MRKVAENGPANDTSRVFEIFSTLDLIPRRSKCRLAILRGGGQTEADVLRTNATFARSVELLFGLAQQVYLTQFIH